MAADDGSSWAWRVIKRTVGAAALTAVSFTVWRVMGHTAGPWIDEQFDKRRRRRKT